MRDSRAVKMLSIFSTSGLKPPMMSFDTAEFSPNTKETCWEPKVTKSSTRSMVFSIMLMLFCRISAPLRVQWSWERQMFGVSSEGQFSSKEKTKLKISLNGRPVLGNQSSPPVCPSVPPSAASLWSPPRAVPWYEHSPCNNTMQCLNINKQLENWDTETLTRSQQSNRFFSFLKSQPFPPSFFVWSREWKDFCNLLLHWTQFTCVYSFLLILWSISSRRRKSLW